MDRARVLCGEDGMMMYDFSKRSLNRLENGSLLFSTLPILSAYIDENVRKEIEKDRLIIEAAAGAFLSGAPACALDLEDIFEKTKSVDRAFLDALPVPFISISVRYGDIADIRIRRIWRIARTVYDLLKDWPATESFDTVVPGVYTEEEFKGIVMDILDLYSEETRILSRSITVLPPFNRAMHSIFDMLFHAMEQAVDGTAEGCTNRLFRKKAAHV